MPRAYSYDVITPPAISPVDVADVRTHLNLNATFPTDAYLQLLIDAATEFAEDYMGRTLINTEFRTFRDFWECCFTLRRSKLQSLEVYKYLVDGSFIDVPADLYYPTFELAYSNIVLKEDEQYPDDLDERLQSIKIEFTAGYGAAKTDVPGQIRWAILEHIAAMYENKGDCDTASMESLLPAGARDVYDQKMIMDVQDGCI